MKQYVDIVKDVLENGEWKENRTGIKTLALPGVFFAHHMKDGFPLLTLRKMPIRSLSVELEGFLKGITSKGWYQKRGCKFWDHWANPKTVEKEGVSAFDCDDLGPLGYSYQLRNFNKVWDEDDNGCLETYDQLKNIVNTLHENPNDRRMVAALWNPVQVDKMALPPCITTWIVNVIGGKLNLSWIQRSCDLALGLPSNIASNGLLLTLLAKQGGFEPGKLTGLIVDAHIYENHVEPMRELLQREVRPLPSLEILWAGMDDEANPIKDNCCRSLPPRKFNIFNWNYQEIKLHNYEPHDRVNLGNIAV